jgi:pimeloyl-ACP methyl ester carboxylesterase
MKLTLLHIGLLITVLAALLLPTSLVQAQTDSPPAENPEFSPAVCPIEIPAGYAVECGMVTVPEDHTRPDGPSIRLAVAIIHTLNPDPAPDPVLFIHGGPGGGALESLAFVLESLGPLLASRDLILLDQRGTGYSEPALECPEIDPSETDPQVVFRRVGSLVACRDRLTAQGIDLSAYNSAQNAADVARVRQALGYETCNLYGVSYGTRVVLTILRDHPQGVRSVILDAITPIEADLLLEDPVYAEAALRRLFAACRDDTICRTVYPNLEQVYAEVVRDLAVNPVPLEVVNAEAGRSRTTLLDGVLFNGYVIGGLAMPQTSGVPGLIYEVRAGNYESIIAALESEWEAQEREPEPRPVIGLQMAVLCNEEAPFASSQDMAEMLARYPPDLHLLAVFDELLYTACQAWGIGPADLLEDAAVKSDIPALVLAGEYDAARAPADARRAAETLSNSTVVEFPGAGHGVALSGECPKHVMADFVDDPSSVPDASCIAEMDTPQFYVTVNPTRPGSRVVAVMAGMAGLAILLVAGIVLGRLATRRQIAWRVVLRRVGWRPLALSLALSVGLYLAAPTIDLPYFYEHSLAQTIVIVSPLVMAVQTALLVAANDEPGLEMLLACPRPFPWLSLERLAVALAGQVVVMLALMAAGAWFLGEKILPAMGGWLSSTLFLSGLAAFCTVRSRKATVGVLVALLAWLVLGVAGSERADLLLPAVPLDYPPPWPRPLGLIQPLLWMAHPFLRPDALTLVDFALNRVIVGGLGLGLLAWAMALLANSEQILLGAAGRGSSSKRQRARSTRVRKGGLVVDPGLARLGAMLRYEWLMGWRRGTQRIVLVSALLVPQMLYLPGYLFGPLTDKSLAVSLSRFPELVLLLRTDAAILANITTLVLIVLLLPLTLSELIPLDQQYRVREILDALPLRPSLYLAGKLLSVWPALVAGLILAALVSGALAWHQNGPYQVGTLAAFWMTGLIPLALLSSQIAVLFSAGQPSRRRAILTGLLAVPLSLAATFLLPVNKFLFAALLHSSLTPEKLADPAVVAALPPYPEAFALDTLLRLGTVLTLMVLIWLATAWSIRCEEKSLRFTSRI